MKKKETKPTRTRLEELESALLAIRESCDTFMVSPTCPSHIRPWFEHIKLIAEVKE